MFRRQRDDDEPAEPEELETPAVAEPPRPRTAGPYDEADAPDDALPRIDLGGIQVPVPDGVELRLEVDEESGSVVAAVAVIGPNALQIGAFAAPKTTGIWEEVAQEISDGLRSAGGGGDLVDGTFGRELHGRIPMEGPNGQRVVQPARFIGVDGPRWFLRGLLQGPASTDPVQAAQLEDIFRGVVVCRGNEAMAPRDAIPLRMPKDVDEAVAEAAQSGDESFSMDPFERGPEITETR
ncbi:MAG: hypothetical protein QOG53_788 [Frankiales bacterium]|nr:hypothetical protein [Frankiales bacterium]